MLWFSFSVCWKTCEDKEGQGDDEEEEAKIIPKWRPGELTEIHGETDVVNLIEEEKKRKLEELAAATVAAIEKAAAEQYAEELRLEALERELAAEEEEEEDEEDEEGEEGEETAVVLESLGEFDLEILTTQTFARFATAVMLFFFLAITNNLL